MISSSQLCDCGNVLLLPETKLKTMMATGVKILQDCFQIAEKGYMSFGDIVLVLSISVPSTH